jgi:hypothetical protein
VPTGAVVKRENGAVENAAIFAVTLISAAGGITVAAFSTFETKDHSEETRTSIERRLERIENKLDLMLDKNSRER